MISYFVNLLPTESNTMAAENILDGMDSKKSVHAWSQVESELCIRSPPEERVPLHNMVAICCPPSKVPSIIQDHLQPLANATVALIFIPGYEDEHKYVSLHIPLSLVMSSIQSLLEQSGFTASNCLVQTRHDDSAPTPYMVLVGCKDNHCTFESTGDEPLPTFHSSLIQEWFVKKFDAMDTGK